MTVDSIGTSQRDVEMIYSKLADTYGRAWSGSFSKGAMRTWWEAIHQYPADMVFKVVSTWMETEPRPPNLPQLLHVLKSYAPVRPTLPPVELVPGSPEWREQKETGQLFIQRLRDQLKNARPFTAEECRRMKSALRRDDLDTVKNLLRSVGAEA